MRIVTGHEVLRAEPQLNIAVEDAPGSGGASHVYSVYNASGEDTNATDILLAHIRFQNGPVPINGVNGVTMEALNQINIDRLQSFQAGPFASTDNQEALNHLLAAQECMHRRTRARIARDVEGRCVA